MFSHSEMSTDSENSVDLSIIVTINTDLPVWVIMIGDNGDQVVLITFTPPDTIPQVESLVAEQILSTILDGSNIRVERFNILED